MNKRVQKTKSSKNSSSLILHPEPPVPLTQAAGRCVANQSRGGWNQSNIISRPIASRVAPRQMLLQVLEEASVAEVIDVSTEKHQLRVDVIGHTVVGGHGAANNGWHHEGGGNVTYAVPTAFHQGTKSAERTSNSINNQSVWELRKPARFSC